MKKGKTVFTSEERNGLLWIVGEWQEDYFRPRRYRLAWPTGRRAERFSSVLGKAAVYLPGGNFRLADGRVVGLKEQTSIVWCVSRIKKPRWAREWAHGEWV